MAEHNGNGRALSKREEAAIKAQERQEIEAQQSKEGPPIPFEPRCHVCRSPYRNFVDALLVKGSSYSYIADKVPGEDGRKLDRRSVSLHSQRHLGYQQDALRKVLEEEADFQRQNYEDGVKGAITHRGIMEVAVRKFYDDLTNNVITVEAKDAWAAIQMLEKLNLETGSIAVEEMTTQVECLVEAIREISDEQTGRQIAMRAEELYKKRRSQGQIPVHVVDSTAEE